MLIASSGSSARPVGKGRTQEEFVYTFNDLQSGGCQVIVACDRSPASLQGLEHRLYSRFQGGRQDQLELARPPLKVVLLSASVPFKPVSHLSDALQRGRDVRQPLQRGRAHHPAKLSGYPAVSIPAGRSASGLPIGLQAYARRHEDALLLDLAQIMEHARPWPKVAPNAPV